MPLIFDAFPDLARTTPWMPLAKAPTAVEPCSAIASWLGRDGVWMKRDDLVSDLYGGNKVRRFEFLLADARSRGKKRLVTVGGLASTQAMATALFGRASGFAVTLVLFEQPVTEFAKASVRGFAASGADIVYGGGYLATAFHALRHGRSDDAYFVMPGAAGPRANLGYVDAMLELGAQVERGELPRPDVIVLPTGSAGTLAGLALGAAHLGWPTEIIGVRITTALACNRFTAQAIIRRTDRYLAARDRRWKPLHDRVRFSIDGGELGKGYGFPTDAAREGAARFEALTGATGEITYSGKALSALRRIARDRRRETILLWNTLSTPRPALSDEVPNALRWVLDAPAIA